MILGLNLGGQALGGGQGLEGSLGQGEELRRKP